MKRSFCETDEEENQTKKLHLTEPEKIIEEQVNFTQEIEKEDSGSSDNSSSSSDNSSSSSDNSSNSNDNSSSSSDSSSNSSSSEENIIMFTPNSLERQVIKKSFAMICRSRCDDWNGELPVPDKFTMAMILKEKAVFYVEKYAAYDVIVEIRTNFQKDETSCKIVYTNEENNKTETLYLFWKSATDIKDNKFKVVIEKDFSESSYVFFSRKIMKKFIAKFGYFDIPYFHWCDASEARNHLYNID
jgi:hypothetical protein